MKPTFSAFHALGSLLALSTSLTAQADPSLDGHYFSYSYDAYVYTTVDSQGASTKYAALTMRSGKSAKGPQYGALFQVIGEGNKEYWYPLFRDSVGGALKFDPAKGPKYEAEVQLKAESPLIQGRLKLRQSNEDLSAQCEAGEGAPDANLSLAYHDFAWKSATEHHGFPFGELDFSEPRERGQPVGYEVRYSDRKLRWIHGIPFGSRSLVGSFRIDVLKKANGDIRMGELSTTRVPENFREISGLDAENPGVYATMFTHPDVFARKVYYPYFRLLLIQVPLRGSQAQLQSCWLSATTLDAHSNVTNDELFATEAPVSRGSAKPSKTINYRR